MLIGSAFSFLPHGPFVASWLLYIGLTLLLAGLCGEWSCRVWKIPRITGYTLVGLLTGTLGLYHLSPDVLRQSRLLVDIALGLLLFELGSRFSMRWLRRNPWIVVASLCESGLTFIIVFGTLILLDVANSTAVIIAAVMMATSPAVVMQLRNDLQSEGQVTERMLTLSALNTVYAVVVVKLALAWSHQGAYGNVLASLLKPLYLLAGSVLLAFLLAKFCTELYKRLPIHREQGFAVLFGMLLVVIALTHLLKLSTILTLLLAGVLFKNWSPRPPLGAFHFGTAGRMLTVILFVFTASVLRWDDVVLGGAVGIAAVIARLVAKPLGTVLTARRSGLDRRKGISLGLTLSPMSALAFVLVDDTYVQYPQFDVRLHAIVMCSIVLMQLVSPWLVYRALASANESQLRTGPVSRLRKSMPSTVPEDVH